MRAGVSHAHARTHTPRLVEGCGGGTHPSSGSTCPPAPSGAPRSAATAFTVQVSEVSKALARAGPSVAETPNPHRRAGPAPPTPPPPIRVQTGSRGTSVQRPERIPLSAPRREAEHSRACKLLPPASLSLLGRFPAPPARPGEKHQFILQFPSGRTGEAGQRLVGFSTRSSFMGSTRRRAVRTKTQSADPK